MRRLYLHIGYPQTGTISIQRFFVENSGLLAKDGVLYPRVGRFGDAHHLFSFDLAIGLFDCPPSLKIPTTLRQDLHAEIEASLCDTVVISSEYFAAATFADKAKVKTFFGDYEVKVLVYLARHDYALESAFVQSVKSVANPPWASTIDSFIIYQLGMSPVSYDYLGALRQWATQFGHDAIVVRPFEASQDAPDIYCDFLQTIGIKTPADSVRPKAINTSLRTRTIRAIQAVRRTTVAQGVKSQIISDLISLDEAGESQPPVLASAIREAIVRRYNPTYQVIAREFMRRSDGLMFKDAAPKATDEVEPIPVLPKEIFDLILAALAKRLG